MGAAWLVYSFGGKCWRSVLGLRLCKTPSSRSTWPEGQDVIMHDVPLSCSTARCCMC